MLYAEPDGNALVVETMQARIDSLEQQLTTRAGEIETTYPIPRRRHEMNENKRSLETGRISWLKKLTRR